MTSSSPVALIFRLSYAVALSNPSSLGPPYSPKARRTPVKTNLDRAATQGHNSKGMASAACWAFWHLAYANRDVCDEAASRDARREHMWPNYSSLSWRGRGIVSLGEHVCASAQTRHPQMHPSLCVISAAAIKWRQHTSSRFFPLFRVSRIFR